LILAVGESLYCNSLTGLLSFKQDWWGYFFTRC